MSIQTEIDRLSAAKTELKDWCVTNNVSLPANATLSDIATAITGLTLSNGIIKLDSEANLWELEKGRIYFTTHNIIYGAGEFDRFFVEGDTASAYLFIGETNYSNTFGQMILLLSDINSYQGWYDFDNKVLTGGSYFDLKLMPKSVGEGLLLENGTINFDIPNLKKEITISGLPSGSTYKTYYFPLMDMCWCAIYLTGDSFATGARHVVGTVPSQYAPARRTALAIDGLQDYAEVLKASIASTGEISFTTSVAKTATDDMYISGWWLIES